MSTGLSGDRRIGTIWQYPSVEATKTLVSSHVLSRLDYCNAVLAGSPQVLLDKIQRETNCSACLIYKAPKSAHITPLLFDLHWLLISSWIQYKIALTSFHTVSDTAPPYLPELLHLYSASRSLCSVSDVEMFRVPRVCKRTLGERSFLSSFLCQACHVTLFQVKSENPPLLFCLLICHFLLFQATPWLLCLCFCSVCSMCAFWNECAYLPL